MDSSTSHPKPPPPPPSNHHQNDDVSSQNDVVFTNRKVWTKFSDSFRRVQYLLDRNRILIEQVNENHRSKIHENMAKNVKLIQEINRNVAEVVAVYAELSSSFSSAVNKADKE